MHGASNLATALEVSVLNLLNSGVAEAELMPGPRWVGLIIMGVAN